MNYRLQLSPISGTRESQLHLQPQCWDVPLPNSEDTNVFRSWLVYDSDLEPTRIEGRVNWNTLLGLALAVVVSVSFWLGLGTMMARIWK